MNLRQKAHDLPAKPGVYFLKDKHGDTLYIGKAKRLNKRVISYFLPSTPQSSKNQRMIFFVTDFTYQLTDTELEALLLEQEMIARLHPPYNRLLNHSERYVYLAFDGSLTILQEPTTQSYGPFTMYNKMPEFIRIISDLYNLSDQLFPAAKELHQKRYCALPDLSEKEKSPNIHSLLKGGDEGLQRLQILQDEAIFQQAFEWAQNLQADKEILRHFQKQAQLLEQILTPEPQIIWDEVDEKYVKFFCIFQGSILRSEIIPRDTLKSEYHSLLPITELPPEKSFIPLNEIDKCYILAHYLKKSFPKQH